MNEVLIKLSKKDIKHISNCNSYYDACGTWVEIADKIIDELKKKEMMKE